MVVPDRAAPAKQVYQGAAAHLLHHTPLLIHGAQVNTLLAKKSSDVLGKFNSTGKSQVDTILRIVVFLIM